MDSQSKSPDRRVHVNIPKRHLEKNWITNQVGANSIFSLLVDMTYSCFLACRRMFRRTVLSRRWKLSRNRRPARNSRETRTGLTERLEPKIGPFVQMHRGRRPFSENIASVPEKIPQGPNGLLPHRLRFGSEVSLATAGPNRLPTRKGGCAGAAATTRIKRAYTRLQALQCSREIRSVL